MSREPHPRDSHAAVGIGQKLYVWGGYGGSAKIRTTTIERFDVCFETWEEPRQLQRSLPDGLSNMAVACDGERAFSFGGTIGTYPNYTYLNTLYEINLSTLQCKELLPRTPSQAPKKLSGSRMVYFNHKLIVHGGRTPQGATDELHVFDLQTSKFAVTQKDFSSRTAPAVSMSICLDVCSKIRELC